MLEGWLEWVRATMPKLAIYVEIDYSNQMILDLTTGSLDLAVLYSPQHLPDMMGTAQDFLVKRAEQVKLDPYDFQEFPVIFWDLFGEQGHPIRATVSEMGPLLLSRLMNLTEAQEGIMEPNE